MTTATVDFVQEADLPELFALFAQWYPGNPRFQEKDYFDWQYRDAPIRVSDSAYDCLVLRQDDGRITGCLGVSGCAFQVDDQPLIGAFAQNWYAKNQRGGGLMLFNRFLELTDHRFLIRMAAASIGIASAYRMPVLPALPRFWAVLDAAALADAPFGVNGAADRAVLARSAAALAEARTATARFPIATRLDPDHEFGLAGREWQVAGHIRRTGRYLNWRYLDIPRHNYALIHSDTGFAAYLVEPVMHTEVSVIRLLDWTFSADETAAALASILIQTETNRPVLIDFHCSHREIAATLAPFGFVPQQATTMAMPDLFRPTNHTVGCAVAVDLPPHRTLRSLDFEHWYLTLGDGDAHRVRQ